MKRNISKIIIFTSIFFFVIIGLNFNENNTFANEIKTFNQGQEVKTNVQKVKVLVNRLSFRDYPDGNVIGMTHRGWRLTVYGARRDTDGNLWYKVYVNNRFGYIYGESGYVIDNQGIEVNTNVKKIIVLAKTLSFRDYPNGNVLRQTYKGWKMTVYGARRDTDGNLWYKVYVNNRFGYIYGESGYVIDNQGQEVKTNVQKVKVLVNSLSFRDYPDGNVIGMTHRGWRLTVYGARKDADGNLWYKVYVNNRFGYIYGESGYVIDARASNNYVKYYAQIDPKWAFKRYGYWNMSQSGCVPTALAMILSTYNVNKTPYEIADDIYYNTNYFNRISFGTYGGEACRYIANKYNFNYKVIYNISQLKNELSKGHTIFAQVQNEPLTVNGSSHAVVLRGTDYKHTTVYNPSKHNGWKRWDFLSNIWNWRSKWNIDVGLGSPFISVYK